MITSLEQLLIFINLFYQVAQPYPVIKEHIRHVPVERLIPQPYPVVKEIPYPVERKVPVYIHQQQPQPIAIAAQPIALHQQQFVEAAPLSAGYGLPQQFNAGLLNAGASHAPFAFEQFAHGPAEHLAHGHY